MLTNIKQRNCSCCEDKYSTNGLKCTHLGSVLPNNLERRSGIERCQYSYNTHIPERRSGKDRRSGFDRRLKPRTSKQ